MDSLLSVQCHPPFPLSLDLIQRARARGHACNVRKMGGGGRVVGRGRGGGLGRWWLGVGGGGGGGGGRGGVSGVLEGGRCRCRFLLGNFSSAKVFWLFVKAVSCCLLLVPCVHESPVSGISPADLFVFFVWKVSIFVCLSVFQSFDYKYISWSCFF